MVSIESPVVPGRVTHSPSARRHDRLSPLCPLATRFVRRRHISRQGSLVLDWIFIPRRRGSSSLDGTQLLTAALEVSVSRRRSISWGSSITARPGGMAAASCSEGSQWAKRMRTKLREIKEQLMATRNNGIDGQGEWLAQDGLLCR
jgi:hypothetical protein